MASSAISTAWIHKVLTQVNPDASITAQAAAGVVALLEALRPRLAPMAAAAPDDATMIRQTLARVLPGDLVKYAYSEATKAMRKHAKDGVTGLVFHLRDDGVAVSAALEYVCAELLELSGKVARAHAHKRVRITAAFVLEAILADAQKALFAPDMDATETADDAAAGVLERLARALAERPDAV